MSSDQGYAPRISVLMPAYNHEKYVAEAVDSVLQTRHSADIRRHEVSPAARAESLLELVVVDDGSTDRTAEVLEKIDDPRLRLIRQDNRGAHAAFNRALREARGEIVFLINSDDLFHGERLSRLSRELAGGPAAAGAIAAASWLQLIDPEARSLGVKKGWHNMPPWPPLGGPRLGQLNDPRAALLESNWLATTSNLAFRRRSAEGLSFKPLRYCHDWDFMLQLARRGPMAVVEEPLVSYRIHPENTLREGASHRQGWMRFEILWVLVRHAEGLLPELPGSLDDLRQRLWNSLPRFGRPSVLHRLFALRGPGPEPGEAFDDLLRQDNPLRQAFIAALDQEST